MLWESGPENIPLTELNVIAAMRVRITVLQVVNIGDCSFLLVLLEVFSRLSVFCVPGCLEHAHCFTPVDVID